MKKQASVCTANLEGQLKLPDLLEWAAAELERLTQEATR
jgi:hypothetical protein